MIPTADDGTLEVKPHELQLGDVVKTFGGGYGDATVWKIADGNVHLFRVYVHVSETVYVGPSVITYVGHEHFSIPLNDSRVIQRYRRFREKLS